jgi:peroxiredoxin
MVELGTLAPDFALRDVVSGKEVRLSDFRGGKGLLVMFVCNHCPFVKHVQKELAAIGREYGTGAGVDGAAGKGLGILAISSNDVGTHPEDSPEKMKLEAAAAGYTFPYCYDQTQEVAKAYRAACTPDFFLFGPDLRLVYRGQLDDSRPKNGLPVTGADLRAAMDAVLTGRPGPKAQMPSIGCNIKWKAGNEPEWARSG